MSSKQGHAGAERQAPLLVTSEVAAEMLGISPRLLRRLEVTGKIPRPVRIGRAVRWEYEVLRAWIWQDCPALDAFVPPSRGGVS
jgi:predicted DNA-binding transcriptional regulator AlpA